MTDREHRVPKLPDRIVDPRSEPHMTPRWRGNLPHIYKEGCTYFVTFCLADAVSKHKHRRSDFEAENNPELIATELDFEPFIGSCLLRIPQAASIVEGALLHFQGERYALSAWCVMPNHVHLVVAPYAGFTLPAILHSWKSFSAHEINRVLGRAGGLWEREAFDHLVRDEHAFSRFVDYTENNPVTAGLCESPEVWAFSSARFRERQD